MDVEEAATSFRVVARQSITGSAPRLVLPLSRLVLEGDLHVTGEYDNDESPHVLNYPWPEFSRVSPMLSTDWEGWMGRAM